jgi:hypothetical protein
MVISITTEKTKISVSDPTSLDVRRRWWLTRAALGRGVGVARRLLAEVGRPGSGLGGLAAELAAGWLPAPGAGGRSRRPWPAVAAAGGWWLAAGGGSDWWPATRGLRLEGAAWSLRPYWISALAGRMLVGTGCAAR